MEWIHFVCLKMEVRRMKRSECMHFYMLPDIQIEISSVGDVWHQILTPNKKK